MSSKDLDDLDILSELKHILRNDIICARYLLFVHKWAEADHRLQGTLKSLEEIDRKIQDKRLVPMTLAEVNKWIRLYESLLKRLKTMRDEMIQCETNRILSNRCVPKE